MPTQYWCALAHERFQPDDLLKQAEEAEQAGFDGICCSDHLAPWWTDTTAPTSSGNAWVWLGAANATTRAKLGPAVTAIVHRYNPVVVAHQVATLEMLAPGRAFLGVGSGEAIAPSDEQALEAAREWKWTLVDEHYTDDVHKPEQIYRRGEDQVSDEMFAKQVIASADPHFALPVNEQVLPALRS